ncbi:hypothetical protein T265_16377, partial [Opisthorchis viverrini]
MNLTLNFVFAIESHICQKRGYKRRHRPRATGALLLPITDRITNEINSFLEVSRPLIIRASSSPYGT